MDAWMCSPPLGGTFREGASRGTPGPEDSGTATVRFRKRFLPAQSLEAAAPEKRHGSSYLRVLFLVFWFSFPLLIFQVTSATALPGISRKRELQLSEVPSSTPVFTPRLPLNPRRSFCSPLTPPTTALPVRVPTFAFGYCFQRRATVSPPSLMRLDSIARTRAGMCPALAILLARSSSMAILALTASPPCSWAVDITHVASSKAPGFSLVNI